MTCSPFCSLCGPIHRLRLYGFCCPCLESEADHQFRLADLSLKTVPIRWLRKIRSVSGRGPSASLFDGICNCGSGENYAPLADSIPTTAAAKAKQAQTAPYVEIGAALTLVDTRYGPAIRVTSNQFVFADDDAAAAGTNHASPWDGSHVQGSVSESVKMTKTIPLREVDSAGIGSPEEWTAMGLLDEAADSGVIVKSKPGGGGGASSGGGGVKVLVFEVCPPAGASGHSVTRDEVVRHINTLVDWEKNRSEKEQGKKLTATAGTTTSDEGKDYALMNDKGGDKDSDKGKASAKDSDEGKANYNETDAAAKEKTEIALDKDGKLLVAVSTATLVPEVMDVPAKKAEIV